jgi:septal ring factor EnvC (AmiA/AmiB activator)
LDKHQRVDLDTAMDKARIPLKWVVPLCSLMLTGIAYYASDNLRNIQESSVEVRQEMKEIGRNIATLNTNVAVLLTEQNNTKAAISRHDQEIENLRNQLVRLNQKYGK